MLLCRTTLLALTLVPFCTVTVAASAVNAGKRAQRTFLTPFSYVDDEVRAYDAETSDSLLDEESGIVHNETIVSIHEVEGRTFPRDLHDCALIGGSSVLLGKGRGPEIDAHNTVIRVNRLPTVTDAPDFGTRVDILYLNSLSSRAGNVTYFGGENKSIVNGLDGVNPTAVIVKSPNGSLWANAPFPVLKQVPGVHSLTKDMRVFARSDQADILPSSGFCSFVIFVPICDKLTLYGFGGGDTSADGHYVGEQHDFQVENQLMDQMIQGGIDVSVYNIGHRHASGLYKQWWIEQLEEKHGLVHIIRE